MTSFNDCLFYSASQEDQLYPWGVYWCLGISQGGTAVHYGTKQKLVAVKGLCELNQKPMELKFSSAKPENVKALNKLVNSAYRGDSSRKGWTTEADLLEGQRTDEQALLDMISDPNSTILLALADEELRGCVFLKKTKSETCYLGMLTVDPTRQNEGVGAKLLKQSETWGKSQACSEIKMTVISIRQELINWYLRHGYQATGEKEAFPYGDTRFGIPRRQDLEFVVLKKKI